MNPTLPKSWQLVRLGDICQLNPRDSIPKDTAGIVSFVPMSAINESVGEITAAEERNVTEVMRGYTAFRDGDVLFAKITPCMENGKAAIARNLIGGRGFGSTEFHVLRPTRRVLAEWLFYFVRRESFRRQAARNFTGSAGQQRVPSEFLHFSVIPLPPLTEQRRILEVLQEVDSIRELHSDSNRLGDFAYLLLFEHLFGHSFNETSLRNERSLEDFADVQGGLQVIGRRARMPLQVPYLRVANVHRHQIDLSEVKEIGVTEAELRRTRLQKGDILIVEGHGNPDEVGRAAVWNGTIEICVHQNHLIRVRCLDEVVPEFLCAAINSHYGRRHFQSAGRTTSVVPQ